MFGDKSETNGLVIFGAQIVLYKNNSKEKSWCTYNPNVIDYHDIIHPFTGKSDQENPFTSKRIIVIQME